MTRHDDAMQRAAACRSDFEIATILGEVQVDGFKGLTSLPAEAFALDASDADIKAQRAELITAVRSGKHLELAVNAITWRQRPSPNRRGLRLAPAKLADRAPSWRGKPFLVDHNTHRVMESSKGTILSSRLVEESPKIQSFQQSLQVVKPDAVIGFLDGTLRSFSISWFPIGAVLCTVHGSDVLSSGSCGCWPLESVVIDGRSQIVQYEFSDYEGKETSGVVVGAVSDTSVEGVRAALSAELGLHPGRPRKERTPMALMKLAAALALTALTETEEDRAVSAVTSLRERAAAAELEAGTLRTENTRLTAELAAQAALAKAASGIALDGMLAAAYAAGKLVHGKDAEGKNKPDPTESLLRDYGLAAGADKLAAKLAEMAPRIPLGQAPIVNTTKEPESTRQLAAVPSDAQIERTAAELGVSVDDVRARLGLGPVARAGGAS